MARSDRRERILQFIQEYIAKNGYPPTIREIGGQVGIKSTSVVEYHLNKMTQLGMLEREQRVSRGLRLGPESTPGMVPLLGTIVAGEPIPVLDERTAESADDWVEVAESLLPRRPGRGVYALTVKGNSMIDALVHDGDIVIMEQADAASDGDLVAAWIRDREETTLKRYYRHGDRIRLQPANPSMDPIFVDEANVAIQGRVVAVIRRVAA
jgi:repressor LexA